MERSGHDQVSEFMRKLEHPLKQEIEEVRSIILGVHPEISEHIKWNAPSYRYQGEDRLTFHLRGKDHFQLVFHCGAKVKAGTVEDPLLEDHTGLLQWKGPDRAIARFTDMEDVMAKKRQLTEVIIKWLDAASSSPA